DGYLWVTGSSASGSTIVKVDPATGALQDVPASVGADPLFIARGPDGNLWYTSIDNNSIGRLDPQTEVITVFGLPSLVAPNNISAGPDGNVWFTPSPYNNQTNNV